SFQSRSPLQERCAQARQVRLLRHRRNAHRAQSLGRLERRARRRLALAGAARMTVLCRDCFALSDADAARCKACKSPRLVHHNELAGLSIAHIDCDAFYATVEKRDNPELADKPLIVGGGKRGVVTTACY